MSTRVANLPQTRMAQCTSFQSAVVNARVANSVSVRRIGKSPVFFRARLSARGPQTATEVKDIDHVMVQSAVVTAQVAITDLEALVKELGFQTATVRAGGKPSSTTSLKGSSFRARL